MISGVIADRNPASGYALTKANFPCLIEAFIDTGISGNNLVGTLGTITMNSDVGWIQPGANQFRSEVGATFTPSGTWEAIGTRHAILMQIGVFNTQAINTRLGAVATTSSIGVRGGTATDIRYDGSNEATFAAVSGATYPIQAVATLLDQTTANGEARRYVVDDGVELGVVTATNTGDISKNYPAFSTNVGDAAFTSNTSSYYTGIFLLAISAVPADAFMFAALKWMIANPKKLYPGFYRKS